MFIVLIIVSMLSCGNMTGIRRGAPEIVSDVLNVKSVKSNQDCFAALWDQHHEFVFISSSWKFPRLEAEVSVTLNMEFGNRD